MQGVLVGALVLTAVVGFGARDATAATSSGATCDSLYAAATYAGYESLAAGRRGDTVSENWWWSIYVSLEWKYVKAGCLNGGGETAV
jgi:hypothetical protein